MQKSPLASNPFALMMNPEAVLEALEAAQSQWRVKGKIYRPLDKPNDLSAPQEARTFDRRKAAGSFDD